MRTLEYDGGTVYYVEEFTQLAFPLSRSGSSLPTSLIHRMRDRSIVVETTYEPVPVPASPQHVEDGPRIAQRE